MEKKKRVRSHDGAIQRHRAWCVKYEACAATCGEPYFAAHNRMMAAIHHYAAESLVMIKGPSERQERKAAKGRR